MKAIGIMSGTSLDGIDICLVNIHQIKKVTTARSSFEIIDKTIMVLSAI